MLTPRGDRQLLGRRMSGARSNSAWHSPCRRSARSAISSILRVGPIAQTLDGRRPSDRRARRRWTMPAAASRRQTSHGGPRPEGAAWTSCAALLSSPKRSQHWRYVRGPIETESPEEYGYDLMRFDFKARSRTAFHASACRTAGHHPALRRASRLPQMRELIAAEGEGLKPDDLLITAARRARSSWSARRFWKTARPHGGGARSTTPPISRPRGPIGCDFTDHDLRLSE